MSRWNFQKVEGCSTLDDWGGGGGEGGGESNIDQSAMEISDREDELKGSCMYNM